MRRRRRATRTQQQSQSDAIAAALAGSDYELIAWCALDAAVEAINMLGAATIDDALALFEPEQEPRNA